MSQILGLHNFKSQSVVTCDAEPVAICTSKNKLFVATLLCTVNVYDVDVSLETAQHWFFTESLIQSIQYNEHGNYIISIEVKETWKKKHIFIKLYLNWHVDSSKNPMKARMSGDAGALNVPDANKEQMEVVSIEYKGSPSSIASCQMTSNLAVSFKSTITLYRIVEKSLTSGSRIFKDVEAFAEITTDFDIRSLSLSSNYVAVMSRSRGIVLRLTHQQTGRRRRTSLMVSRSSSFDSDLISSQTYDFSHSSYIGGSISFPLAEIETKIPEKLPNILSPYSVSPKSYNILETTEDGSLRSNIVWDFKAALSEEDVFIGSKSLSDIYTKSVAFLKSPPQKCLPKSVHLKSLHKDEYVPSSISFKIIGKRDDSAEKLPNTASVLLNCSFGSSEVKHMRLVSSTVTDDSKINVASENVFCYIGSSYTGRLYCLDPNATLVSSYHYDGKALCVCPGESRNLVTTECTLEVYSSHCRAHIMQSKENIDGINTTWPNSLTPPVHFSSRPFVGIVEMAASCKYVFLLAKVQELNESLDPRLKDPQQSEDDHNIWTLYALENYPICEVCTEMMSTASRMDPNSIEYCHLLQEIFMMLKSYDNLNSDSSSQNLLTQCSSLLGYYYSRANCIEEFQEALPYFLMSGLALNEVLDHFRNEATIDDKERIYGKGLMNYLHHILFVSTDSLFVNQVNANKVIEIYCQMAKDDVPKVILCSNLNNYDPNFALNVIKNIEFSRTKATLQNEAWLARTVLCLQLCDPAMAEESLNKVQDSFLTSFTTRYPTLIHSASEKLTPLAQLICQHFHSVFIRILVSLRNTGALSMNKTLSLLTDNASSDQYHEHNHAVHYLEAVLSDESSEEAYSESIMLLCNIYSTKLLKQLFLKCHSPSQQIVLPQGHGGFGQRFSWLDGVSPLKGQDLLKKPCQYFRAATSHLTHRTSVGPTVYMREHSHEGHHCPCAWCNQILLKFQMLMCSQYLDTDHSQFVMNFAHENPDNPASLSLRILSYLHDDRYTAVEQIISAVPHVLPEFVYICVSNDDLDMWKHIMAVLNVGIHDHLDLPDDQQRSFLDVYIGVLNVISKCLTPTVILSIIPPDGNLTFFSTFIKKCCENEESNVLKWRIIQKGAITQSSFS